MADDVVKFVIKGYDQFSGTLQKLEKGIFSLKGAFIGLGLGAVAKSFLDAGDETEKLRIRLKVLTGSAEEGTKMFASMSQYASQVPFTFEQIMQSATDLTGVLAGGRKEVEQYMPLIGDLAAATGLSLEETTSQVIHMFGGGAAAADLFRQRGVLAMLGFQEGVHYTTDQTKKMLLNAWTSPTSKFKGATADLATTFSGVMSMMQDKWFQFRVLIMDAGLLNYIKAIAKVIDESMGKSLSDTKKNAEGWASGIIDGIKMVMKGVGVMADGVRGIEILWKIVKLAVIALAAVIGATFEGIASILETITNGWIRLVNLIISSAPNLAEKLGLHQIEEVDFTSGLDNAMKELAGMASDTKKELQDVLMETLPSEVIQEKMDKIQTVFDNLQAHVKQAQQVTADTGAAATEGLMQQLQDMSKEFLKTHSDVIKDYAKTIMHTVDTFSKGMGDAFADAIVDGKNLMSSLVALGKQVLKELISNLIKVAIQRAIMNKIAGQGEAAKAGAGGVASMAAAPFPINLTAPAFGAAMFAQAQTFAALGARAMGGQVNANQAYVVGERGPEIFTPNISGGITANDQLGGGGGTVHVEQLHVNVLPNATNGDALLKMTDSDWDEVVAAPIIRALDRLDDAGIRPKSVSRLKI